MHDQQFQASCLIHKAVFGEQSGICKTALILQAITVAVLLITFSEWKVAWLHYFTTCLQRSLREFYTETQRVALYLTRKNLLYAVQHANLLTATLTSGPYATDNHCQQLCPAVLAPSSHVLLEQHDWQTYRIRELNVRHWDF